MSIAGFDRRDYAMLVSLFKMTLADRFLGSSLGIIWAVLSPLLLMAIFVFVFTFVFPGRLPGRDGTLPFIIWLISGYAPWIALSEGLGAATSSVTSSSGIVKNIAFKSELLPIVGAMLGLVPLTVGLLLIFFLQILTAEGMGAAAWILPVSILLQLVLVSGMGLFLSALNVFLRDTALALPSVLTMLLFASPIFYPITSYPEWVRGVLIFNPFYIMAELYRAPIMEGRLPPIWMLGYLGLICALLFAGGLWWFRRLKSYFDTRL